MPNSDELGTYLPKQNEKYLTLHFAPITPQAAADL
jgi:hypothetical protein